MDLEEGFLLSHALSFEFEVLPKCLVMMIKQRTRIVFILCKCLNSEEWQESGKNLSTCFEE